MIKGARVWFDAVTLPENPPVINTETQNVWGKRKRDLNHSLKSLYKWVKDTRGGGGGGEYLQTAGEQRSRKKRGRKWERKGRKGLMHFLLRTCHISGTREGGGEGGGGRRDRGRRDGRSSSSSHDSKTFSNHPRPLLRHFSSGSGSEGAGGWRGQPLSDVDSDRKKTRRRSGSPSSQRLYCSVWMRLLQQTPWETSRSTTDTFFLNHRLRFCPDTENKMTSSSSMPQTKPLKVTCKLPEPYEKQAQQISDRQTNLKSKGLKEIHTK